MKQEYQNDIVAFSDNIKQLRQSHNLSKKSMAKIMGIGIGSLNKLESGILPPRADVQCLLNLNKHFGISISELFVSHSEEQQPLNPPSNKKPNSAELGFTFTIHFSLLPIHLKNKFPMLASNEHGGISYGEFIFLCSTYSSMPAPRSRSAPHE